jgi:phage host-nuclease inhibitor protein Gam
MNDKNDFILGDENEVEIQDLLDTLADLRAQQTALAQPFAEQIAALEKELAETTSEIEEQINALERAVKRAIIAHGASVKGARMHAIYVQPRITWDTKRLEGYAEAHPEIKAFRRVGKPSVRITTIE